jgi:hypothetical protein
MKVVGFTFIRNAIRYDYPIKEAILSILPLCDEVVVAVGASEDATLALIQNIDNEKIKVIQTVWDDSLREGGEVLAVETNKAFDAIAADADWCIYIQGDEILPEQSHDAVCKGMKKYLGSPSVEGLLFDYVHFYGSYDFVGDSRRWYRKEIRVIKNDKDIRSYRDAQGFRKAGRKLKVVPIAAQIYHYGWVKHPAQQQLKQQNFNKLWHDDNWVAEKVPDVTQFDYTQIDSLRRFEGTHPKVMQARIQALNWTFNFDPTRKKLSLKERISRFVEQLTGWRMGEYKNYKIINPSSYFERYIKK